MAPIEQVVEERWGRGAVLLVGDAAHGMSPNMAQGAALAFEDALVLAASLRQAGSLPEALAGFVARRSPRTGWVRAQTHRRDRTRNLPPLLRNLTLRAFGRHIFRANYRPLLAPIEHLEEPKTKEHLSMANRPAPTPSSAGWSDGACGQQ